MKAVVQRVSSASVLFKGERISTIGTGLCVLIGIEQDDDEKDCETILKEIKNGKYFCDKDKNWKKRLKDIDGEILCISQFTLCSFLDKKYNIQFRKAMNSINAKILFDSLIKKIQNLFGEEKVKKGLFGEYTQIEICNEGPVTILLDSKRVFNQ